MTRATAGIRTFREETRSRSRFSMTVVARHGGRTHHLWCRTDSVLGWRQHYRRVMPSNVVVDATPLGEGIDMQTLQRRNSQVGQGLAEYSLILALIAILAITALLFLGG